MATLSSVAVDFIANTAKYVKGLEDMSRSTKKWANDTKKDADNTSKNFDNLGKNLVTIARSFSALGAAVAAIGLVALAKNLTNTASQLADLSDQLNISTENLQRLQTVFQKSGVGLEDITSIYSRLQKSAIDAAGGNDNLRKAFADLGISVDYFNKLQGAEKLEIFAIALNNVQDPAKRSAFAVEILGKASGKTLAGLRDIAEKGSLKNAADDVFTNSETAINALDRLGDSADELLTILKRLAIEGFGRIVNQVEILSRTLGPLTVKGVRSLFGLPDIKAPAKDIQAAIDLLEKRTQQNKDNADALAQAQLKLNDVFLSAVDPAAKYRIELSKLREEAAKNNIPSEILAARERALTEEFQKQTREIELNRNAQARRTRENVGLLTTGPGGTSPFAAPSTAAPFFTPGQKVQLDLATKALKDFVTFPSSPEALQAQIDLEKRSKTLTEEYNKIKQVSAGLIENTRTAQESYSIQIGLIEKAATTLDEYGKPLIDAETRTRALDQAQQQLWEKTNPQIMQAFDFMSSFADQFSRAIAEGQNFGDALSNVFKNILRDIAALILKTTILQAIMASIGIISPNTQAAATFGKLTGLIPRAEGGPVMAGGAYRVGESGPETFIPAETGYILPNDMTTGETVVVNQNIYVQTGVSQTVKAEMLGLLPRFKQEALAGVLDAKQRGGSYSKGLAA